ncbi:MAG: ABC transporter ATP-binding protein [Elusimicrobia bacterium]|nr:ABC transporter ATP-binding protein [Elusimicrobiota bacterium]
MTPSPVKLIGLTKKFGDFTALSSLDIEVEKGEITGLLGPNGAGKTTTIKLMTGLLKPTSGRVLIAGIDIADNPVEAKKKFALVPDAPFIYGKLTAWEFMFFIARLYNLSKDGLEDRVVEQLRTFNIYEVAHDLIDSFSHGMKQRLILATVMLRDPEIIILDEPMVGLDPEASRMVKNIFKELSERGKNIFLSTHTLSDATELCSKIAIISSGRLIAHGSYSELEKISGGEKSLEDIYLKITRDAGAS